MEEVLYQFKYRFRASLWIRSGFRLALKRDVGASAQTYQVGAGYKALIETVLKAPLNSIDTLKLDSY